MQNERKIEQAWNVGNYKLAAALVDEELKAGPHSIRDRNYLQRIQKEAPGFSNSLSKTSYGEALFPIVSTATGMGAIRKVAATVQRQGEKMIARSIPSDTSQWQRVCAALESILAPIVENSPNFRVLNWGWKLWEMREIKLPHVDEERGHIQSTGSSSDLALAMAAMSQILEECLPRGYAFTGELTNGGLLDTVENCQSKHEAVIRELGEEARMVMPTSNVQDIHARKDACIGCKSLRDVLTFVWPDWLAKFNDAIAQKKVGHGYLELLNYGTHSVIRCENHEDKSVINAGSLKVKKFNVGHGTLAIDGIMPTWFAAFMGSQYVNMIDGAIAASMGAGLESVVIYVRNAPQYAIGMKMDKRTGEIIQK